MVECGKWLQLIFFDQRSGTPMRKLLIILTIFIGCSAEKIQPESNKQRVLFKVVYINSKTPTIVKDLPIYSFDAEIKDLIYCRDKDGNQVILNKKEIVALRPDGTPFIQ